MNLWQGQKDMCNDLLGEPEDPARILKNAFRPQFCMLSSHLMLHLKKLSQTRPERLANGAHTYTISEPPGLLPAYFHYCGVLYSSSAQNCQHFL